MALTWFTCERELRVNLCFLSLAQIAISKVNQYAQITQDNRLVVKFS